MTLATVSTRSPRQDWPFGNLRPMSYGVVLADCPWHFTTRSPGDDRGGTRMTRPSPWLVGSPFTPADEIAIDIAWLPSLWPVDPQTAERARLAARVRQVAADANWLLHVVNDGTLEGYGYDLDDESRPRLAAAIKREFGIGGAAEAVAGWITVADVIRWVGRRIEPPDHGKS